MPRQIFGLLLDIDGVLYIGNHRIPGALEALTFLHKNKIPFLLITNTTRRSRVTIWHHLKRMGFPVEQSQIFTASLAAIDWLENHSVRQISVMLSGSVVNEFKNFRISNSNPEYVVIGDLGSDLTFEKLNNAFRLIMKGAKILALQKSRYWQTEEGLFIDAGAIVAALEFATRKRAIVIGKPKKDFFLKAAQRLNISPENLAIVGDDLETDIRGGKEAGLFAIAVKTGKFREDVFKKSKIKPDAILNSIGELPKFLKKIRGDLK